MYNGTLLCQIDNLLGHYGPCTDVDADDISGCLEFLFENGLLIRSRSNKFCWRDYEHALDDELRGFHILKRIVDGIIEYTSRGASFLDRSHCQIQMVPYQPFVRGLVRNKMNGALVSAVEDAKSELPMSLVYFPHEYHDEEGPQDIAEIRLQAARDFQYILNKDPRRMFIFAITVEDDRMSVWYFSRSHCMKALSFDWIDKDIETCIHVFLAFARATPRQLGLDETVTLAPGDHDAEQHYIYRCPVELDSAETGETTNTPTYKYFKTVQVIKGLHSHNLSCRCTRVWKVVEVKGSDTNETVTGEELVLKDVWLDDTRPTEAENLDSIFAALEQLVEDSKKTWDDTWKTELFAKDPRFTEFDEATKDELRGLLTDQRYKSLFLTKLHAWQGERSLDVCASAIHAPPGVNIYQSEASGGCHSRTVANPGRPFIRPKCAPRTQWRFIYKEVCSDLDSVGTLGNVMDVLNQSLKALRILFCAGWVHRDISSNNILAFNDNGTWKAKLSDLELSHKFDFDPAQRNSRLGTPYFMPIEIGTCTHFLQDMRPWPGNSSLNEGTAEYDTMKNFYRIGYHDHLPSDFNLDAIPDTDATVYYNFHHDLESVWWIIVYFITARVDHKASQKRANQVFRKTLIPSGKRVSVFKSAFTRRSFLGSRLHQHLDGAFLSFIDSLRSDMYTQYIIREVFGRELLPNAYSAIHASFAKEFANLLAGELGRWKNMPILPAFTSTKTSEVAAFVLGIDRDDLAMTYEKTDRLGQ